MAINHRTMSCPPESVFAVLADGWLYPSWVVGASRMRDVDPAWPTAGSVIYHSVGVWPALIDDTTSVLEWDPPRHALFKARGWPLGEAHVALDVKARGDGCVVRITEDATAGPGRFSPLTPGALPWTACTCARRPRRQAPACTAWPGGTPP